MQDVAETALGQVGLCFLEGTGSCMDIPSDSYLNGYYIYRIDILEATVFSAIIYEDDFKFIDHSINCGIDETCFMGIGYQFSRGMQLFGKFKFIKISSQYGGSCLIYLAKKIKA
jgi:hypothetical protein